MAQEYWRKKPSVKLDAGDQLVFHYALRGLCQRCGKLMDWESPEGSSQLEGECCGMRYTLQPHTVTVEVEDVSIRDRPLMQGETNIVAPVESQPLSDAQRSLRATPETPQ